MKLRTRFSIALALVFLLSLCLAALVSYFMLHQQARSVVEAKVEFMMNMARAIRGYTVREVRPNLKKVALDEPFLPQSVPAYAAVSTLGKLPAEYQNYSYREAAINPTNPRDKALSWESEIIKRFAADPDLKRLLGQRDSQGEQILYVASPIRITNKACLSCHGDPDIAPPSLIKKYGPTGGFGWKMNEVVAAQIGTVPMSVAVARANHAFLVFMGLLALAFAAVLAILNLMLSKLIVNPISRMATDADKISTGDFDIEEFPETDKTEVGRLGLSFNRMRRSLQQALQMIKDK